MNVTALPNPTALPPIQMKRPKKRAHANDVMPWSKAGRRRCIARDPTEAASRGCGPKKFTEPVALSSTSPGDRRLPPRALGSGFDRLALRARCKREGRRCATRAQGGADRSSRNLRELPQTQRKIATTAVHYKGVGPEIHRAGGAFVHLPREPSASA